MPSCSAIFLQRSKDGRRLLFNVAPKSDQPLLPNDGLFSVMAKIEFGLCAVWLPTQVADVSSLSAFQRGTSGSFAFGSSGSFFGRRVGHSAFHQAGSMM